MTHREIPQSEQSGTDRKAMLAREMRTRQLVDKHRRELSLITKQLSDLADKMPDTKSQISAFNRLMPTARAVAGNGLPLSMETELNNLNSLADNLAAHLKDNECRTIIGNVKSLIKEVMISFRE